MTGTFIVAELSRIAGSKSIAVAICALGRSMDFATTWVGITGHRAEEAKPCASAIVHLLGTVPGLITYEALITTPVIFLGCKLANIIQARHQSEPQRLPMSSPLLYSIGIISIIVAFHNLKFLL